MSESAAGHVSDSSGRQILPAAVLVCLGAAFVLRPMPVWALTFYLGVLPATAYRLWHGGDFPWRDPAIVLTGSLILWFGLTLLWGQNPGGGRVEKFALGTLCTTIFFVAIVVSVREVPETLRRIMTVVIIAAAGNAALSIVLFFGQYLPHLPPIGARLEGWAETNQSILGSLIIGVGYLAALDRVVRERRYRLPNLIAVVLCIAFVALSGSRGPLLSVMIATIMLMVGSTFRVIAVLIGIGIASVAFVASVPSVIENIVDRPSDRIPIWVFTLQRVAERPWFGHGLAANLEMTRYTFPHSLYLSALFYGGIVGFFLLMAVIFWISWLLLKVTRTSRQPLLLALWVMALCGGLTDLGQITKGPSELWLNFWLPLSLACAVLSGGVYEPRTASPFVCLPIQRSLPLVSDLMKRLKRPIWARLGDPE